MIRPLRQWHERIWWLLALALPALLAAALVVRPAPTVEPELPLGQPFEPGSPR